MVTEPMIIPALCPRRAAAFYGHLFHCEPEYAVDGTCRLALPGVHDGPGVTAVIRLRVPLDGAVLNTFEVASLDQVLGRTFESGGQLLIRTRDANGTPIGFLRDTEENYLLIQQA